MEVTGNIQWEVTLARSALWAPYMVRINPENTATLQRLLAGAATDSVSFDYYYCADLLIFSAVWSQMVV